jgi:cytochrome c oxidase subunit II
MSVKRHRVPVALAFCVLALSMLAWADAPADAPPRTIEVVASRFKFTPAVIEVTEGERVQLKVRSSDGTHGIGIKDFQVKAKLPKTGETVTVEFVASKAGRYVVKCSEYCGGGHSRMKSELIVHPKGR